MKIKGKKIQVNGWLVSRNIILGIGFLMIAVPLYLVVINAFKSLKAAGDNFFAFPKTLYLDNFRNLFSDNHYWGFVGNSAIITVISISLITLFVPLVSYAIARNYEKRYYKFIYFYLLMGLFIPSQVIMLPVTKLMTSLNLLNKSGLILLYLAFSFTQGVFLFVNFIRGLPLEIEEAAHIDGCTVMQTYSKIMVPMMKPMLATIIVMDSLWIWNDFLLPLMILNKSQASWTLPLFQYNFKTEYSFDYTMAFTAYLMSMLPILIVYACGQKYIVKGLTAGAVKG